MSRLFCYGSEGGLEKLDSLMKAVRFIIVEAALLVPDRPFFRKINRFVESSMERVAGWWLLSRNQLLILLYLR